MMKKGFYRIMLMLAMVLPVMVGFAPVQDNGWKEIPLTEYDQFITRAGSFYDTRKPYSVDISFSSYRTHTGTSAYETQSGYMIRSGNNFHSYLIGLHTYQNQHYRFVVDSAEQNIMVANPDNSTENDVMGAQYKILRSYIVKAYMIQGEKETRIRAVLKEKAKVARFELYFDKKGFMTKSVSFLNVKLNDDPDHDPSKATAPRMETVFRNYKTYSKLDETKEFGDAAFFGLVNGKLSGKGKYKDYYIKDTRMNH